MKSFQLILMVCALSVASGHALADEKSPSISPAIEHIEIETLNFENLPKDSQIGTLSNVVGEEGAFAKMLHNSIRGKKKNKSGLLLYPQAEGLAYINGQLCHVGNYPRSVIYTVLEGPYYGTQTTMTYDGFILYVNYEYVLEPAPGGVILYHYYDDSVIITGSNQVIRFY